MVQASLSFTRRRGILRGLHFQYPPHFEAKLVRCVRGAIFDAFVDLRPESPTYLQHFTVELTAENRRAVYVPPRFAHAHQVLEDNSETLYQVSGFYAPEAESGLSYADPQLAIAWPLPPDVSEKDQAWPPLSEVEPALRGRLTLPQPTAVR
jgi:dTDP-4-dehydrorhamnose 3,5-epimerase